MASPERRDSAQILLRTTPDVRDRIRRAIPKGQLNGLAIELLLRHAQEVEARSPQLEDSTTAA